MAMRIEVWIVAVTTFAVGSDCYERILMSGIGFVSCVAWKPLPPSSFMIFPVSGATRFDPFFLVHCK
jgi:hypothetical protein